MSESVRPRTERVRPKKKRRPANRRHFTEGNVKTFPVNKQKQYMIWDAGTGSARGLAILVNPTGTKSYRCVFYFPGSSKPHFKKLGRVGVMSLKQARELTDKAREQADEGVDPRANDPRKSDNFKAAVDDYIEHHQKGKLENKSADKTKAVMLNGTKEWHERAFATIRFDEIEKLLWSVRDGKAKKGKDGKDLKDANGDILYERRPRRYLANRLYSHLKDFFAWHVKRKILKVSPMADTEQPWDGAERRERKWFKKGAADNAIKSLWNIPDKLGDDGKLDEQKSLSPNEKRYLKMMILTGKRKTALANMRWEEIDKDWYWEAPESDVDNKRLHGVPLPDLAKRVLHPKQAQGKVFGDLNLDALTRKIRKLSGMSDFFWHGLRHLAETKTAEITDANNKSAILPFMSDMLFDHASKRGSGAHYNHHDYIPEMRAAMEVWANYIERLITPEGNVARLR